MKRTKTLFGLFLLLLFILSLFSINTFILNVKALPDQDFTFDDNVILDTDITKADILPLGFVNPYNLKNVSEYTNIFNASYSFTNEIDGTFLTNIGFIDTLPIHDANTWIAVNDTFEGHDNVLHLVDNNNVGLISVRNSFTIETDMSIEFWFSIDDLTTTNGYGFSLIESGNSRVLVSVSNNDVEYHSGAGWFDIKANFVTVNNWIHIKLVLDDSANTFDAYINNELEGNDLSYFANSVVGMDTFQIASGTNDVFEGYFDAVGYSFLSNYSISDNLIPFLNVSERENLFEVDRYEFAFSNVNTINTIGLDNPNGWTDIEVGGGDEVGIFSEPDGSFDRVILIDVAQINDLRGIHKDNLGFTGNLYNVTFGLTPIIMNGIANRIQMTILSSDDTIVTSLRINADLSVERLTTIWTDVNRDVLLLGRIEFNFLISYELNRVFLLYSDIGGVVLVDDYPLMVTGKEGLHEVFIQSQSVNNEQIRYMIDYIGIYKDGRSLVQQFNDFGLAPIDLSGNFGIDEWNIRNNNLITIKANGTLHLGAISGNYFNGIDFFTLKDTHEYINITQNFNAYDGGDGTTLSNPQIIITVYSQTLFNISILKIDGVVLNESTNSYPLIFEHSGVDTNESFFFVEGNRLSFTHIANDTNVEFIQARFNINDISSDGFSLSFLSRIDNNALGFMRINFTSISNIVQFPLAQKTTRFIITQNLTIRDLIILVTDRDLDSITGLTTGFISQIKLLETSNISVSLITVSLIALIIPLILIIIPTLAISTKIGKNFIVPLFLLFSVIAVATNLIPIWLFFVIGFASLLFLTKKESREMV